MPILYAHPFSSYCMKALIALYEADMAFEFRMLDEEHPGHGAELARLSPAGKFPILVADDETILEASIIVEWVDRQGDGGLIPTDAEAALKVRMLDRVFDNYVMAPMQLIVADANRAVVARHKDSVEEARAMLDHAYAWLDRALADREWAAGDAFGLADCAAAPALLYADWVHPIPADHATLHAYRDRLLARPTIARVVDEARPYRPLFPMHIPADRG